MFEIDRREFLRVSMALGALVGLEGASAVGWAEDPNSLTELTLSEAAQKIRSHQITSVELTQSFLERIKIYNPKLNAFITVMTADAMEQAKALDAEAKAGKFRGPLHGLPIALKDNIDTAGTRTTAARP
jgi:aspartyl-tRNA(Asn)/glutamyl-tRNA(Gln) amidotransferase subunit A